MDCGRFEYERNGLVIKDKSQESTCLGDSVDPEAAGASEKHCTDPVPSPGVHGQEELDI